MEEVFETYVDNAFNNHEQATIKFKQFEFNYKKEFPEDKSSKVLDIGVGRGEMLTCMKSWGFENYLGVDISPSTIQFCKKLKLNCEQTNDTIKWLNAHPEEFDMITLLDVLEHFKKDDVISMLKALRNSLKNNGKLIIQVPNLQAPDGQLHRYNDFTHEIGFVEHSLKQVLLVSGFTKFNFFGFEDKFIDDSFSLKKSFIFILRFCFWKFVRVSRRVSGNLNPEILHPVFYVVVNK